MSRACTSWNLSNSGACTAAIISAGTFYEYFQQSFSALLLNFSNFHKYNFLLRPRGDLEKKQHFLTLFLFSGLSQETTIIIKLWTLNISDQGPLYIKRDSQHPSNCISLLNIYTIFHNTAPLVLLIRGPCPLSKSKCGVSRYLHQTFQQSLKFYSFNQQQTT